MVANSRRDCVWKLERDLYTLFGRQVAVDVSSRLFHGRAMMCVRGASASDPPTFSGRKRRLDVQLQGQLLRPPPGALFIGAELARIPRVSRVSFSKLLERKRLSWRTRESALFQRERERERENTRRCVRRWTRTCGWDQSRVGS